MINISMTAVLCTRLPYYNISILIVVLGARFWLCHIFLSCVYIHTYVYDIPIYLMISFIELVMSRPLSPHGRVKPGEGYVWYMYKCVY